MDGPPEERTSARCTLSAEISLSLSPRVSKFAPIERYSHVWIQCFTVRRSRLITIYKYAYLKFLNMHIHVFLYLYLQISASVKERVCVEWHTCPCTHRASVRPCGGRVPIAPCACGNVAKEARWRERVDQGLCRFSPSNAPARARV